MTLLNRRTFLQRGGATAVGAGLLAAAPGLSSLLPAATAASGPESAETLSEAETAGLQASQVVAHVTDLRSGDISLYIGERHVAIRDAALAARIVRSGH